ncbi:ATP-binding protein [Streptococcus pluranimalium]|uniref:ATP-binding protein n=1 Tax=Streptococcus pluranimalium TaxID=82348 RepID=UPI0039FD6CE9
MIRREYYIKQAEKLIDTEFIKVITGVRRSGKSFLLKMIFQILRDRKVSAENIMYINFEHPDYFKYDTHEKLYDYIKETISTDGKCYFLFDEIQEVSEWQKLINGLRVAYDCDIFITGSNASLLSGELATYLTGRYLELKMYTLSFREYLTFKALDDFEGQRYIQDYLTFGGFPSVVLQKDDTLKKDVLSGIYNSILYRDVTKRAVVKEPEILNRVATYLLDNVGQLVSTNKIANTIRSTGRKVSNATIESYIQLLEDSFLFYKASRYDIRGKELLKSQAKYYTVDLGLITSQLHKPMANRGTKVENLVFLELKRRGYGVFVGKYDTKEIDFVASKYDEVLYIQVTDRLPEHSTRETDNLLHLPTGHKKIVITNSWDDVGQIDGVDIIHLTDFLLEGV